MRLFRRWAGDRKGFFWTAVAAGLVAVMGIVPNLWPHLFGIGPHGRAPGQGQLLAYLIMAVALLDRWRPVRWFLLVSLPATIAFTYLMGRPMPQRGIGWAIVDVAAMGAFAILLSPPVGRYFRKKRSAWGDADEADAGRVAADRPELLPQGRIHIDDLLDREPRERDPVER